jgi:hypothetical protein
VESSAVEPLSVGVQIGLRVPVILLALAGVLIALLMIKRLGPVAGILAAAGSLLIAADQAANIAWILHLRSMTSGGDLDIDTFNTVNNAYLVADAVLITIGVALVVASFAVRRPAVPALPPVTQPWNPGQVPPAPSLPPPPPPSQ